jgi:hypothetical protein
MNDSAMTVAYHPTPWNKGKLIGQKPPLKLREIWTLRTRLEMAGKTKELALFNLAIQAQGLRPGAVAGERCSTRWRSPDPCQRDPAEDP